MLAWISVTVLTVDGAHLGTSPDASMHRNNEAPQNPHGQRSLLFERRLSEWSCEKLPPYVGSCPNYYGCHGSASTGCSCLGYCNIDAKCCLRTPPAAPPPSQPPGLPPSSPSPLLPPSAPPSPPPTPPTDAAWVTLQLAQTHVIESLPAKVWNERSMDQELHLIGRRKALAIVEFGNATIPAFPRLRVTNDETGVSPVVLTMKPTSDLPPTAGDVDPTTLEDGSPYSSTAYSVIIPADLIVKGLTITIPLADGGSDRVYELGAHVGCPTVFKMVTLPFYFFGAGEFTRHSGEFLTADYAGMMTQADRDAFYARLPVSNFTFQGPEGRKFEHRDLIVRPKSGLPAMRLSTKAAISAIPQYDGYTVMGSTLQLLGTFEDLDGEHGMATQYYAPLVMVDDSGWYTHPGGGLGGGHVGTGDHYFGGIFFHEQGHAFGIPHVGDEYPDKYPYENGGLKGSSWAWDEVDNEMIDVYWHGSMGVTESVCPDIPQDELGRCYKQDPMQSGGGNTEGKIFHIFADFNVAVIQKYFEGTTATNGRLFYDEATGVYNRWDPTQGIFVPQPRDQNHLRYRAASRGVPVIKIIAVVSCFELRCFRTNDGEALALLDTSALHITNVYQVGRARATTTTRHPTATRHPPRATRHALPTTRHLPLVATRWYSTSATPSLALTPTTPLRSRTFPAVPMPRTGRGVTAAPTSSSASPSQMTV